MARRLTDARREDWQLLDAQREWLRAARDGAFAPWPRTASERESFRALLRAHRAALHAWLARYFSKEPA